MLEDFASTGGEAPAIEAAPIETPVDATPEAVEAPIADAITPEADPSDPYALLDAAMKAELGDDAPAEAVIPPVEGEQQAIPEAFQQALTISEYVKSAENVQQAVRAADEVWKVANGQAPASSLLEGMRGANPQAFEGIVQNLTQYIEQITGKTFGGEPAATVDPQEARIRAIESRFRAEEQTRQDLAWNQQVSHAHKAATTFLTDKLKGTFAEGQEAYMLQQCAAKANISEKQMVELLNQGKTDKLEAAYRSALKDEKSRLMAHNANLAKNYRKLVNGVPASKGAPAGNRNASSEYDAYLPGETSVQYATRQFNKGK